MLIHYRCESCGATLSARDDYEGQMLPCPLCRHHNTVPHVARAVTQDELRAVAEEAARREYAAFVARESEAEGRRLARIEARRRVGRGKPLGTILAALGALPSLLALAAIVTRSMFGFTFASLALSIAFGSFAMLIGVMIRQAACAAIDAEYRRLVPILTDRVRQEQWRIWEAERGLSPAPPTTVGTPG